MARTNSKRTPARPSVPIAAEVEIEVEPVTVSLWPAAGRALNLSRSQTYACGRNGTIPTRSYGRSKRVPVLWLRAQASAEPAAEDS
jgi:hypothetical protein